jgi:hypothetical protein
MPETTRSPLAALVPCTTTDAPSAAKCFAMALPIPDVEPVTMAIRLESDGMGGQRLEVSRLLKK